MVGSPFNIVDLGILFILGTSILVGVFRGATREVLGIAAWIGTFIVVFYGLPLLRPLGYRYIENQQIADLVIAVLLIIISLAVFILISRLISSCVKESIFGGLDRTLGLVFGLLRGAIIICLIYALLLFFFSAKEIPEAIKNARFTPWVMQGVDMLKTVIPKDYLPKDLKQDVTINPLDAKDLLQNTLPTIEETVKNLSTLKPTSPKRESQGQQLEDLIEKNDPTTAE